MDEVTIVDRVQVDIDDLGKLADHVAIPPAEQLEVVYVNTESGGRRTRRVYGFTAGGDALVVPNSGARLVAAHREAKPNERLHIRRRSDDYSDRPVGPFTPAPKGLTAVFTDGRRLPIAYYDVHGRSVCIDDDAACWLFVVHEDNEVLARVEEEPTY
ncbi:hypothetical protein [Amycolatopsis sacchari]|uniref:hypothetical protein n=1 Tax=Amycolatopsis sacchari TaxID=115433 RepID=UPI001177D0EA|nr:hypothetical protein [Amycolatopsis sacchari]